jgi:hypothetical protein
MVDLGPGIGSVPNGGTIDADLTEEQVAAFENHPLVTVEEKPEAEPETLEDKTVEELKEELREQDLPVSGNKDELIERLEEASEGGET